MWYLDADRWAKREPGVAHIHLRAKEFHHLVQLKHGPAVGIWRARGIVASAEMRHPVWGELHLHMAIDIDLYHHGFFLIGTSGGCLLSFKGFLQLGQHVRTGIAGTL